MQVTPRVMLIAVLILMTASGLLAARTPAAAPTGDVRTMTAQLLPPPAVPPPVKRDPARIVVRLETREGAGVLADGVQYQFWTFNGTVPGPMVRVRVGDEVELRLANSPQSTQIHSIDLHAVNGPGGGAELTQAAPGKEKVFRWKALNPGVYVYHCASPHIPTHIANGMYGLILVEPEGGLPRVDREYYVMQSEFYTKGALGEKGLQAYDSGKGKVAQPEYVVFNGRVGALVDGNALTAQVGEKVRIFAGNGGPNLIWSFHVIGEIFDRVYPEGAVGSGGNLNVQTTLVPAGGASIVEMSLQVPGTYLLVDHSIFRIDRGAVGMLRVTGKENSAVFGPAR